MTALAFHITVLALTF